ncbi:unnamed protein product, partial [Porites evermanni]
CSRYFVLESSDRNVANTDQKNLRCDQKDLITGGYTDWYRFKGAAGIRMPTFCVPTRRCGTHAPGWLNGSHPSVREGVVTRRVCYHWGSNCCNWKNDIQIQNCGAYYVYRLVKPTQCYLRYCAHNQTRSCNSYFVLEGFDRNVANTDQKNLICDQRDLSPFYYWYRFKGAAGIRMPTFCVPKRRCGAHAPGWLNGSHPSVREGVVTRRVCYHWGSNCCNWKNDIQIQNCGAFYVYRLVKPPQCYLRYCAHNQTRSCSRYFVLESSDRNVANTDQKNLRCDQKDLITGGYTDWYRFKGAAGIRMPTFCVPTRRCGTHAPGWLNGSHPSVREGVVTRRVCYHWGSNCCNWKNDIQIQNCGAYYVYRLVKPTQCYLRYCAHNQTSVSSVTPPSTALSTSPAPSIITASPGIH